jgi:hypothetical protein
MGDISSDYIFSIDPGIVNVGVACYNGVNGDILFANKLTLAPSLKVMENEAEIIPRVYKLFFDNENSPYKKMIDNSRIVLIENQMKRKMLLVQHVIGALCFASSINYEFVAPQSIKAHFKTGARSRAEKGIVLKGKKTNHKANKKLGIEKAKELFPEYMSKVSVAKQDDIADALLQAVWYSQGGDKFIEKKNETLSKKRKATTKKTTTKKRKTNTKKK